MRKANSRYVERIVKLWVSRLSSFHFHDSIVSWNLRSVTSTRAVGTSRSKQMMPKHWWNCIIQLLLCSKHNGILFVISSDVINNTGQISPTNDRTYFRCSQLAGPLNYLSLAVTWYPCRVAENFVTERRHCRRSQIIPTSRMPPPAQWRSNILQPPTGCLQRRRWRS